ncbi:hypothetical protein Btru_072613 [Bulinus truncatus]|nr:hypothetical protein Btru_072613 [Bulinus truncatus]
MPSPFAAHAAGPAQSAVKGVEMNASYCDNVSIDLSESSLRLSFNIHIIMVIVLSSSIASVFVVLANVLIIVALLYSRRKRNVAGNIGINNNSKLLVSSLALRHAILGGLCMPLTIIQIAANGEWRYGPDLCTFRSYTESLLEIVGVFHMVTMSSDTYLAICKPMKYRLLTLRYGYGMVAISWLIPLAIFVLPVFFGGYRNGKEGIFECLNLHHSCIALYGKNVLLVVLPLAIAFPFCVVLIIDVLILRKIVRFNKGKIKIRKRKRNGTPENPRKNVPISGIDLIHGVMVMSTINTTLEYPKYFKQPPIANIDLKFDNLKHLTISSQPEDNVSNGCLSETTGQIGSSDVATLKHSDKSCKWKAFPCTITLITWNAVYGFSIMVCFLYFAFEPYKFPVLTILAVNCLCYVDSMVNPIFTFSNKYLRDSVQETLRKILFRR